MKKTISKLWEEIFNDYDILKDIEKFGYFKITADQIRKYKEPRLMANLISLNNYLIYLRLMVWEFCQ